MVSILHDENILRLRNFNADGINGNTIDKVALLSRKIRRDILSMVMNANSGHIGGSLSSADIYLMLWLCGNVTPANLNDDERDRIIVSHGHTSPGLYAVLGNTGFFDVEEAVGNFRKKESIYEGHPYCKVDGVEWGSGSLGQGLSVGCGFAIGARIRGINNRIFVVMGDGEQQKGQLTEAAEFAVKHGLNNLTAIIDVNRLQASGSTNDIMPVDLGKKYKAAGWEVINIDGHNYEEIYKALKYRSDKPVMVLAETVMGKGVSFIENNYEYHGKLLTKEQYERAIKELGGGTHPTSDAGSDYGLAAYGRTHPSKGGDWEIREYSTASPESKIKNSSPIVYSVDKQVECRAAAGEAVYDVIKNNADVPIAVVDCDLMESVKTMKVQKEFPAKFIECGIQEHNAATVTGALSKAGVIPFFLDFGVFGLDETYGQHRMNDTNETSIKLIITHCGLDVGEDGKTHQCLDYISLVNNLPGYKLIIPADANQTDRAIRYIASHPGNFVVAMGRSKVPVLEGGDGECFFGEEYNYEYGAADWLVNGDDVVVITTGTMGHRAVKAAIELQEENISVGVLNISSPKKIDVEAVRKACATGTVITYEDHFIDSGLGNLIASVIAENGFTCRFKKLGVYKYGKSCSANEQYPLQGLDVNSLKNTVKQLINNNSYIN